MNYWDIKPLVRMSGRAESSEGWNLGPESKWRGEGHSTGERLKGICPRSDLGFLYQFSAFGDTSVSCS